MMDWEGYQLTWTNIKPRFQHQLATQLATQRDDKLIIKGLSNLAMRPNELTGKLLVRITNTMVIIKESYAAYQNKVPALLHHDASGGYLDATATKCKSSAIFQDVTIPSSPTQRNPKSRGSTRSDNHDLG